jgi:ferritin-like metal-binding protein YciE
MAASTLSEQLVKYLTDVHAMEVQALAQMRTAPKIAKDPEMAQAYEAHRLETEQHEALVRERLEAHDAKPSRLEDLLGALSGKGFVLFARLKPDTPGMLATHAFSYEHMELAAYDLLERVAEQAGDTATAEVAKRIRADEEAMAARIGGFWDRAVDASLAEKSSDDVGEDLNKYLADAHALEAQAIQLLERGPKIAGETQLAGLFEQHLAESRRHQELVERRIEARDAKTNAFQDAAMRLGALNWGGFFGAQPDTPAKLAMFAYAFEHLEIGGYEQLTRVARRAGDAETAAMADGILPDERAAAEKIYALFEPALDASLEGYTQKAS